MDLKRDLDKIASEVDLSYAWERVKGCPEMCPLCSARCESPFLCVGKDTIKHHTKYHRPMAFRKKEDGE